MRKPTSIIILVVTIAIILGWGIGDFFSSRSVANLISTIPASPIVIDAKYNKEKHSITYSLLNSGGVPLTIVNESFVFTPGNKSKEKEYIMSHIPVHIILPPGVITKFEMRLKKGTEKLKIGDVILATFSYIHPLSSDLYTVVHSFKMNLKNKTTKENLSKKEDK